VGLENVRKQADPLDTGVKCRPGPLLPLAALPLVCYSEGKEIGQWEATKEIIMLKGAVSYQMSYFADLEDYVPSADVIPPLLDAFRNEGFLPTNFVEIKDGKLHTRLRLASPSHEWVVDLDLHRINVGKNPIVPWGENLGTIGGFVSDASDFVTRILGIHTVPGTRLALVTKNLLDITQPDELNAAYIRLLKPLPYYVESFPHEWQSRSVTRVTALLDGREEKVNVITALARIQGGFGSPEGVQEFDCISVEFDINTYQGIKEPRFSSASLGSFFEFAVKLRERLLKEIGDQLEREGT